jgi:phosphomannomutase
MTNSLTCFKAYDVRGELGVNFDAEICYRIGRAFARTIRAKTVVGGARCPCDIAGIGR